MASVACERTNIGFCLLCKQGHDASVMKPIENILRETRKATTELKEGDVKTTYLDFNSKPGERTTLVS